MDEDGAGKTGPRDQQKIVDVWGNRTQMITLLPEAECCCCCCCGSRSHGGGALLADWRGVQRSDGPAWDEM